MWFINGSIFIWNNGNTSLKAPIISTKSRPVNTYFFPKDMEYDAVSKATESLENEQDFAECDLFIVLIGCIACHQERLKAIRFKNTYSKK